MLKNILKLEGTQKLSKNEQKSINGGLHFPNNCNNHPCPLEAPCQIVAGNPTCVYELGL